MNPGIRPQSGEAPTSSYNIELGPPTYGASLLPTTNGANTMGYAAPSKPSIRKLWTMLVRTTPYVVLPCAAIRPPWHQAVACARAQEISDSISEAVLAEMERLGIAGLTLAIVDSGEIVHEMGYGMANVELGVPAGVQTVYMVASVTKVFTGMALLMLVEEGRLSLDDRIGDLLNDLPMSWRQVTVLQLLNHTSGLPDVQSEDLEVGSTEELIARAGARPIAFEPGTQWSYNQVGYAIVKSIIETLSGEPWEDFARRRIFDRLGMSSALFGAPDVLVPGRATSYLRDENGELMPVKEAIAPHWPSPFWAGTGLNMTAGDLARFDIAVRGDVLLSSMMRATLWQPAVRPDGAEFRFRGGQVGYAHGWGLYHFPGHPAVGNEGGTTAVYYHFVGDDLAIILLTNTFLRRPPLSIINRVGELLISDG